MSETLERFLATIEEAERAALNVDGIALERLCQELDAISKQALGSVEDPDTLTAIRERLLRFKRLCQFAGETLHDALTFAAERQGDRYEHSGRMSDKGRPGLLQRYG